MSYKEVGVEISKGGYILKQIWRKKNYAIYKQIRKDDQRVCAWEAIRIRTHEGYAFGNVQVEPSEMYPSSEKWGIDGFTLQTERRAYEKIKEMTSEIDEVINHLLSQKEIEEQNAEIDEQIKADKQTEKTKEKQMENLPDETKIDNPAKVEGDSKIATIGLEDLPNLPKKKGRKPKLLKCNVCGVEIYTSVFQRNGGRCLPCKTKGP